MLTEAKSGRCSAGYSAKFTLKGNFAQFDGERIESKCA